MSFQQIENNSNQSEQTFHDVESDLPEYCRISGTDSNYYN